MRAVDLIESPVTIQRYKIYDISKLPKIFLCIAVKNKFDEGRVSVKQKYKPRYVSHFRTVDKHIEPFYYYGIELDCKSEYKSLLDTLNTKSLFNNILTNGIRLSRYSRLLQDYNLSCNTCYSYFSDGIFPIDLQHLQNISRNDMTKEIESGFGCMLKKSKNPPYMSLLNFNILITIPYSFTY